MNDHTFDPAGSHFSQTVAQNCHQHHRVGIGGIPTRHRLTQSAEATMARAHYHHDLADPSMPAGPGTAPTPPAPDFAVLGTTFNDATRALVGGLWQSAVEEGGQ